MAWKQSNERNKRLEKLYEETKNGYGSGAFYNKYKGRIEKYSPSDNSKYPHWLKKRCARLYRRKYRNSDILLQRGKYKKDYDYWWEIF